MQTGVQDDLVFSADKLYIRLPHFFFFFLPEPPSTGLLRTGVVKDGRENGQGEIKREIKGERERERERQRQRVGSGASQSRSSDLSKKGRLLVIDYSFL